jgi:hypothetical protein
VKEFVVMANTETAIKLNVPHGIYFLSALVNGERVATKIIVE